MSIGVRAQAEPLRSFNTATFTGSYQAFGTPFVNPIRIIKITNVSNTNATISFDGTNDHELVPSNSFVLYDFSANREVGNQLELAALTQVYIKGAVGVGSVYLSAYYAV